MTRPATPSASSKDISAFEAISTAQHIAFAPVLFHVAGTMIDLGLMAFLGQRGPKGATAQETADQCKVSLYGVEVLFDMAVSGKILLKEDDMFVLGKVGQFLLDDPMTRANFNFIRDVCYAGLAQLTEAIKTGKPAGLQVFGNWPTIYPALSSLPEPAKSSWFAFDHFYSDTAFGAALPHVFGLNPGHIYDVGGNTGKWALRCVGYNPTVKVTVLDLPEQVVLLKKNIPGKPGAERIDGTAVNMLEDSPLPGDADVWWMSQFLDCFSEEQIVGILTRIRRAMKPAAKVCILEPFTDRQSFKAASFSLNAGSLYFTSMANGNSRFYPSDKFISYINRAGFSVTHSVDKLGPGEHTLLVCSPA